jgi:flagellar protein FliO/FliZ
MTPTVTLADWLQLVASFAFVLGLLGLVLWGLRRMQHSKAFGRKDAQLQVIESLSVGARQKLLLVRVRDQEVLVGVGPHGMTALTPASASAGTTAAASHASATPDFANTLAGLKDNAS